MFGGLFKALGGAAGGGAGRALGGATTGTGLMGGPQSRLPQMNQQAIEQQLGAPAGAPPQMPQGLFGMIGQRMMPQAPMFQQPQAPPPDASMPADGVAPVAQPQVMPRANIGRAVGRGLFGF